MEPAVARLRHIDNGPQRLERRLPPLSSNCWRGMAVPDRSLAARNRLRSTAPPQFGWPPLRALVKSTEVRNRTGGPSRKTFEIRHITAVTTPANGFRWEKSDKLIPNVTIIQYAVNLGGRRFLAHILSRQDPQSEGHRQAGRFRLLSSRSRFWVEFYQQPEN